MANLSFIAWEFPDTQTQAAGGLLDGSREAGPNGQAHTQTKPDAQVSNGTPCYSSERNFSTAEELILYLHFSLDSIIIFNFDINTSRQ
jgi:hypothetical protein